jgi:hypothetical protein
MRGSSRRLLRIVFLSIVALNATVLGWSYATAANGPHLELESRMNGSNVTEAHVDRGNVTVVATQGFYVSDEEAELVAFSESGEIVYHDDSYRVYFDVDPVRGRPSTVQYVSSEHLDENACPYSGTCTRNVVRRVNLTTGEETEVYAKATPRTYSARWHDVDRLNDTHLVVADIVNDGVYAVDTRDDAVAWRWNATATYDRSVGGQKGDWTHINDVEVLPDGRVMVSVRNMDQVVFLEPDAGPGDSWGVNESWTLGSEDDYGTLYEQHNPDYLPASRGGPAVLVADSENGRIIEYQRRNGGWTRSWEWRDARLQWPRDADRLPSGNTLVVDTHGDRVTEIKPGGRVAWSVTIGMPYDAERLGTGDESAGGRSMAAIRDSRPHSDDGAAVATWRRQPTARFWLTMKSIAPSILVNGLLYAGPSWFRFTDLVFASVMLAGLATWGAFELRWSGLRVRRGLGRVAGRARSALDRF